MEICDLKNQRKLKILKELINLEKYDAIFSSKYYYLIDPKEYSESGSNVVYNIECLKETFTQKNYGLCIEIIEKIIVALNSRMFKVKCKKQWDDLISTKDDGVRFCNNCSRHVFTVKDEIELNKRKHLQQCVFFQPEITPNMEDGICIVESEFSELLGLPKLESRENENDILLPFKKQK